MNVDDDFASSGSYVLDAMDPRERERFEAQLAGSDDLRSEVTELTDTAVLLGMAVAPVTPPEALKKTIMARLDQTPQLPRDAVAPDDTAAPVAPVRQLHPVGSSTVRARWYSRPATVVSAAAAAVILIVGGIFGVNLALQNQNSGQQALASIVSASDVQREAAPVKTGGTATLVFSYKLGKAALISKGMKALPSGKTYELWFITKTGTATDAGLFESNGTNILNGRMVAGDTIGVTVEPAGGSKQPTTTPIVAIASA
jgi:anti-sigma-K factor RskA